MDDLEETRAVLVGEFGVAVGLPELAFRVVEDVVVIVREGDEGDLGVRCPVDGVDGHLQLRVLADLGADLLRVEVVLEKLQVADTFVGALEQVSQHCDHLVGGHVLRHGSDGVLHGEHHRHQHSLEVLVVLVHVRRGDVDVGGG